MLAGKISHLSQHELSGTHKRYRKRRACSFSKTHLQIEQRLGTDMIEQRSVSRLG